MPADVTFKQLHDTIQAVTNFQGFHSYAFKTNDLYVTNDEDMVARYKEKEFFGRIVKASTSVKVDDYLETGSTITYEYDFSDDWRLDIELLGTVEDYYLGHPTVLEGDGTAPPEGVGGIPGYASFLEIYQNQSHPEFLSLKVWAEQQRYLPFELDETNEFLKYIKCENKDWEHIKLENHAVLQDEYRSSDFIEVTSISSRDEIIEYAIACANLYGMIELPQFLEIYNEQNEANLKYKTLLAMIHDKKVQQKLADGFVNFYRDSFLQDAVEITDVDAFKSQVSNKPYYVPEKQELLRYVDEFYYQRTPEQEILICELAKEFFDGNKVLAEAEVSEFVLNVQVAPDEVNALVQGFLQPYKWGSKEQLNVYVQKLMDIVNTTRLWENRGHTATELFEMQ